MEEEIKQAPTEVEEGTSPNDSESIDKKDSALIKSIKDKGAHSVYFHILFISLVLLCTCTKEFQHRWRRSFQGRGSYIRRRPCLTRTEREAQGGSCQGETFEENRKVLLARRGDQG